MTLMPHTPSVFQSRTTMPVHEPLPDDLLAVVAHVEGSQVTSPVSAMNGGATCRSPPPQLTQHRRSDRQQGGPASRGKADGSLLYPARRPALHRNRSSYCRPPPCKDGVTVPAHHLPKGQRWRVARVLGVGHGQHSAPQLEHLLLLNACHCPGPQHQRQHQRLDEKRLHRKVSGHNADA